MARSGRFPGADDEQAGVLGHLHQHVTHGSLRELERPARADTDLAEHAGHPSPPGDVDIFVAQQQLGAGLDGCGFAQPDRPVKNVNGAQRSAGQRGLPGRPLEGGSGRR
jgi:hypothetical protein